MSILKKYPADGSEGAMASLAFASLEMPAPLRPDRQRQFKAACNMAPFSKPGSQSPPRVWNQVLREKASQDEIGTPVMPDYLLNCVRLDLALIAMIRTTIGARLKPRPYLERTWNNLQLHYM
jgi:hypothetical protein